MSADERLRFVRECLKLALEAKTDSERKTLLEAALAWLKLRAGLEPDEEQKITMH